MHYDYADLTHNFDSGALKRGHDYSDDGHVLVAQWQGDRLIGEVAGSGGAIYHQTIRVFTRREQINFDGRCTCPVGYNCKHVVAVLIKDIECREREARQAPGAANAVAQHWLMQLSQLSQITQPALSGTGAVTILAWVLVPDLHGHSRLHLRKGRQGKRGGIGASSGDVNHHGLLRDPPAWIATGDVELLRQFAGLAAASGGLGVARPQGALGARLLAQLVAQDRLLRAHTPEDLARGRVAPLLAGPKRAAVIDWHPLDGDPDALQLSWQFAGGGAREQQIPDEVLPTEPACYIDGDLIGELTLPALLAPLPLEMLLGAVEQAPLLWPEHRASVATRMAELGLDGVFPLPQVLETNERSDVAPVPLLVLDSMLARQRGDYRWYDHATLMFDYDGWIAEPDDGPVLRRVENTRVQLIVRDAAREAAARALLLGLGFAEPPPDSPLLDLPGALQLADEAAWVGFVRDALPRLEAAGWQVEIEGDYRYHLAEVDDWYAELDEEGEGGQAWFALELGIVVNGQRHALLPLLLKMIRAAPQEFDPVVLATRADEGDLVIELDDETRVAVTWGRIRPILVTLGELYFNERMGSRVRLPVMDAARLAELERAAHLRWMGGERLRALGRKLNDFDGIRPVELPVGLQADLRPYQRSGLAWLQFLREYEFGGILADDMGLGKTIQALAHILVEKEAGRLDRPALVVAPTSLMPNWQAEAARFTPGLRVLLLHGKERTALFDGIGDADVVLTTYALLGRDEVALRGHRYHLLILDEAQYIKNSRSKAAQTARLLDARHRLCLTGTPVQNHLGELWSQFHFLMPGLLGDERGFNTVFRKPIEQGGDMGRKDLLVRRLKPFMLRRTKDKVATELPPKTEIILPVELGGVQRDLYETVRVAMDRKVRDEIDRKGLARSHIVILEALLKLRQVCCDPRLLKTGAAGGSAKLEALMELLDTLISEGRKVLVFSQFTSMLALIADELNARSIAYVELTGSTVDRAAPVAAFQAGQVGVFLISLKAGGVGLNLTAADTVIHYDPWWNPASENQATDRAWRIGQTQPVFVYKLIARGTLEEKIQDMQRRKGDLANALLAGDTELAPAIGAEDLREIFSPVEHARP
jgi:superfamily II DNA or RNA helicase